MPDIMLNPLQVLGDSVQVSGSEEDLCSLACPSYESCPLKLECIRHRFGKKLVLDDVSLSLSSGEILCLVGPSGCGKTTLLRIAAGLESVQDGTIHIAGMKSMGTQRGSLRTEDRNVGLVFQECALFPHLSVLNNVQFGLWRLEKSGRYTRALETLEQVGLAEYVHVYPHQLSGGQKQRVALARAIAPRPSILLLDEPFSGLDTQLRQEIREETLSLLRYHQLTSIVVTHDPEEAMYLGDRIALMREGKIVQCDTPNMLYSQPKSSFAAVFFGDVNKLEGVVSNGFVTTPFGSIRVGYDPCGCCLSDGKGVEVLIRPEALTILPDVYYSQATCTAIVEKIRHLGQSHLVQLRICLGQRVIRWFMRVLGNDIPRIHQEVGLKFDPTKAFVFPLEECMT